jgi:cation:H+ antiporter
MPGRGRRRQGAPFIKLSDTMGFPLALVFVVAGIGLLAAGGEALVRGAVSLAKLLRVSTAVIGLTVVAMGTSMPELVVSLLAAVEGRSDIAVGNVVGSNIFNIGVILGLTAIVLPVAVHSTAVRLEWPFMFLISFLFLLLARDGLVDRLEGAFFLAGLAVFTAYMVRLARTEVTEQDAVALTPQRMASPARSRVAAIARDTGMVTLGLVLLVAGGRALVVGSVAIAQTLGLTERVIGLTIVAAGTSMPELATSLVAARRKEAEIALANLIGSNIFNIGLILGVVSTITPQRVHPQIISSDVWWMVGGALLLFPLMRQRMEVGRMEGAVLFAAYLTYLTLLLV